MGLTILNINASRIGKREKLNDLFAIIAYTAKGLCVIRK